MMSTGGILMNHTFLLDNNETIVRDKGKCLMSPVDDYVVFDFETTDRNIYQCEIIEIAAIKYINNIEIDRFVTFVKPYELINEEITELTGITNEMVENAPRISSILPDFLSFIGDNVLVGHNINRFDINILYDLVRKHLNQKLTNDFIDTLMWSQRGLSLEHNRLIDVAAYFEIEVKNAHRALADCITNSLVYEKMKTEFNFPLRKKSEFKSKPIKYRNDTVQLQILNGILTGITFDNILTKEEIKSLKIWLENNKNLSGQYPYDNVIILVNDILKNAKIDKPILNETLIKLKQIIDPTSNCSKPINPIDVNDKKICLTGEFKIGSRKQVENILKDLGAVIHKSVNRKTDYLLVGNLKSANWKCGTYGSKIKTALELQEKGIGIIIYDEAEFFDNINRNEDNESK